jgi:Zn-dependent protease with chaperone function
MGHEVSHVTLRHSVRQASKKLINILALAFSALSFEFSLLYLWGFEWFEKVYKLKHSRVHEARADEIGLKLL